MKKIKGTKSQLRIARFSKNLLSSCDGLCSCLVTQAPGFITQKNLNSKLLSEDSSS